MAVPGTAPDSARKLTRDRLAPITGKVDRYRRALELSGSDARRFADVTGPALKAEVMTAATAAAGSDLRPFKNKTGRLGVGYDLEDMTDGVRLVFKLRPSGLWAMAEQGAKPHVIGGGRAYRRGGKMTKTGRQRSYVRGAGYSHPVQAPVWHPGSKGKAGIRYAFKRVRRAQRAATVDGVLAVWRSVR